MANRPAAADMHLNLFIKDLSEWARQPVPGAVAGVQSMTELRLHAICNTVFYSQPTVKPVQSPPVLRPAGLPYATHAPYAQYCSARRTQCR